MLQALARRLGHNDWFAKMGKAFVPLDKAIAKLTRGRVVAMGMVPSLMLTTTGKKSGLQRRQPLVYIPHGEEFLLVGSNWGGPTHPNWSANLIASPEALITVKGKDIPVTALLTSGAEREQLWAVATKVWPPYATYAERCAPRQIRLFKLTRR